MKLYKTEWKLFLRSIYLPILYLISFSFYQWQHLQYAMMNIMRMFPLDGLMAINRSNANMIYLFAVMVFIGFEIRLRSKTQFPADLAHGKAAASLFLAQVWLIASLSAIMFVSALPYDIAMHCKVEILLPSALLNTVLANVLSYLLIPFTAGLMGMALGSVTERIGGYAAMAIMLLIISPATGNFFWGLMVTDERWALPKKLFSFFTPNTQWMSLSVYGVAVEAQRWLLLVFWQAVSLLILLPKLQRKKTVKGATVLLCCGAILVSGNYALFDYGSVMHRAEQELGISFYDEDPDFDSSYSHMWWEEEPDFAVSAYEGSLVINHRLNGDITVTVDQQLPEYAFYLYRGYTIQGIYDQNGTPLPYTREGHTVTVTAENDTETLRFIYSGGSPSHFSNYQAVYLPANFTYYPIPAGGWISSYGTLGGQPDAAEFCISVSAPLQLYSNLSVTDGVYAGAATGMTLQGGILESKTTDGFTEVWSPWYMPGGNISKDQLQKEITELCAEMGIDEIRLPQRFTLFRIESMYPDSTYLYTDDHMIVHYSAGYSEIALQYVLTQINPDRGSFVKKQVIEVTGNIFGTNSQFSGTYSDDYLNHCSDEFGEFDIFTFEGKILAHMNENYGRTYVLQAVCDYLLSPQDFVSTAEYFMRVGGWDEHKEGLQ